MVSSALASTKGTKNVQTANTGIIRPLVAFDGGNRSIQWVDSDGRVHCIPSFIKSIDPTWEDVEADPESVVIERDGETFVIGQAAKDLGGVAIFQNDKIECAKDLVLAALQPNPGQNAVRIERLLMAVPNARDPKTLKALRSIEGTHEFYRNDEGVVATVRRVEAIDETRAAYMYAVKRGVFLSKRQLNGVLDLGGGTSIMRLYSVNGSIMREADLVLPGTFALASAIAARLTKDAGYSPDLTLIMDGIEDGSFQLGTTGIDFSNHFEQCRSTWLDEIKGEVKTRWAKWLPSLGEVLVIGGSAPLAEPLQTSSNGRFKIAENPRTISIVGMSEVE
ncbi:MAG: ParM/StbA family protein [Elainellaceae cyanobacterium]